MKDFALSREELERRLLELDKTRDGFQARGCFAMCYAPMAPDFVTLEATCASCGQTFKIEDTVWYRSGDNMLEGYRKMADEYRELGYDARIQCYCSRCSAKLGLPFFNERPANVLFAFRTTDEDEYHLSPLDSHRCDTAELRMVLDFLKGVDSYQSLDRDYRNFSLFNSADEFRECIARILGLPQREEDEEDRRAKLEARLDRFRQIGVSEKVLEIIQQVESGKEAAE